MKDYDLKDNHYCYKGSFVLKNKFDIKDKKTLDSVEKDITGSILLLLQSRNFHNKEKYLEAMIESPYSMDKLKQFLSNNLRSIE